MIRREMYLQKLHQLKDHDLIKVVTGIRRSGKSSLLKMFKNDLIKSGVKKNSIIFLNFEERENNHLTEWTALYDEIMSFVSSDKKNYIFLDEVQLINDFETLTS